MTKEELDQCYDLYQKGEITEETYNKYKNSYNNQYTQTNLPLGISSNSYNAIMNFAQLLCGVGWFISVVLWIIGREHSRKVDLQGKYIINWIISMFIYGLISLPFVLLTLGTGVFLLFPVFIAFGLFGIFFPIIGGIKSLSGECWKYPLSLSILK